MLAVVLAVILNHLDWLLASLPSPVVSCPSWPERSTAPSSPPSAPHCKPDRATNSPDGSEGFGDIRTSNEVCLSRSRLSHTRAASTSKAFGLAWEYYRMGSKPRWFKEADVMATEEQPSLRLVVVVGAGCG
ncbi:uncharacterized protein BJ171DRAFT_276587 [Polychytrium aggregatum]|uniref:uncharacterized protein n=1 Tax=Polychytrium aggregatum TaxID=110093 RepID=UPI0022FE400D|nr:uncharacterized protein BJ171DRAFT_276587 [Polychytrium aggregatum]KAI9207504.1 hypothetical protein BJ171DRAFT_276587 [Polychytrium aggregatum]